MTMDAVKAMAREVGFPLMLKASHGGGGRGMRPILSEDEVEAKVREGRREAEAAFGNGEGYLEKDDPARDRHVEVQLLGDTHGNLYHLYERDCTVQRRNQKVVERAPAPYLTEAQRAEVCELGLKIGRAVGYQNAGTVEFLMDMDDEKFYFIEVNPRVQVEHTVTEEVTGIDIVKAQIRIAEGATLSDATGTPSQGDVTLSGHALQCRITTEDPLNNFIPDYGRLTAYRSATGMGIRLDGGTAYAGGVITRYYDSLLVKITAWAPTPQESIARMDRALREFRIRGVSTNIAFVENLLKHPTFLNDTYTTKFIDTTDELFNFRKRRDRGHQGSDLYRGYYRERAPRNQGSRQAARRVENPDCAQGFDRSAAARHAANSGRRRSAGRGRLDGGAEEAAADRHHHARRAPIAFGHANAVHRHDPGRTCLCAYDAQPVQHGMLGGGATFDVAYRFLQECPWQRLRDLARGHAPTL